MIQEFPLIQYFIEGEIVGGENDGKDIPLSSTFSLEEAIKIKEEQESLNPGKYRILVSETKVVDWI